MRDARAAWGTLRTRNLTKSGVIKVVITQDVSIQFEKSCDDPMKAVILMLPFCARRLKSFLMISQSGFNRAKGVLTKMRKSRLACIVC